MRNSYSAMAHIGRVIFMLSLLIIACVSSSAQNNKSEQKFSEYLEYCKKFIGGPNDEIRADSLIMMAKASANTENLCKAKIHRADILLTKGNFKALEKEVNEAKAIALKYEYYDYFFKAWEPLVVYYIIYADVDKSNHEVAKLRLEASKRNNDVGKTIYHSLKGDIYHYNLNWNFAKKEYYQAIDIISSKKILEERVPALYKKIAFSDMSLGNYTQAYDEINKTLALTTTEKNKRLFYDILVKACYHLERYDEMQKNWNISEELLKKHQQRTLDIYKLEAKAYMYLFEKNYQKADSLAYFLGKTDKSTEYELLSYIYKEKNDYKNATYYFNKYAFYIDSLEQERNIRMIHSANANMDNTKLLEEKSKLKYNNTKLKLENIQRNFVILNQQNQLTKLEGDRHQGAIDNMRLAAENKHLEIKRNQARINAQNTKLENQKISLKHRHKLNRMILISLIALIFLTIIILYYWTHEHRAKQRTREEQEKLIIADELLKKERDKARLSEKLKTEFIQNMSHEIRTPLNAIVGFSSVLADNDNCELSEEEIKQYTETIACNSDLLLTLVNDILDISNLETNQYKVVYELAEASEICHNAANNIIQRMPDGVKLILNLPKDNYCELETDQRRVQQILINFLTNATKYTSKGSITIEYEVYKADNKIVFSVADTGVGIAKEKADKIFERFEKLNSFKQGTGLGLNICKLIATNLKGKVWLDTNYTLGSRFCLELPIKP